MVMLGLETPSQYPVVRIVDSDGSTLTNAASSFYLSFLQPPTSNVNWNAYNPGTFAGLFQSSGAQNDEAVFRLPFSLSAGTWTISLQHSQASNRGIYTVSFSVDGTTWTDVGTIDGYVAASADTRSVITGIAIPARTKWVRLKMATKNASATQYYGIVGSMSGLRTGD